MKSCAPTNLAAAMIRSNERSSAPHGDVVGDAPGEQLDLLWHDADLLAEHGRRELTHVELVDQDPAGARSVEAEQELRERALAGAGRPDHRERVAGLDLEVDVQEGRRRVIAVAIGHAIEANPAPDLEPRHGALAQLRRLAHQLVEPRERIPYGMHLLPGADHLTHRRQGPADQDRGGDQGADRHFARHDRARPDINDDERHQVLQSLPGVGDQRRQVARPEPGPGGIREPVLEPALHVRLETQRLDRERVADRLTEARCLARGGFEAGLDQLALAPPADDREQPEERHGGKGDPAHAGIEEEQDTEEQADEGEVDEQERHLAGEELAEAVELTGALENLAARDALEGLERQVHQVVDHFAAERRVEAPAGVARDVAAQRSQHPLEQEQRHHAERQDVERLERAVVDDLVIDGHEKDRRRKCQQVDHARGDHELHQHRLEAPDDVVAPPRLARWLRKLLEQQAVRRHGEHGIDVVGRRCPAQRVTQWSPRRRSRSQASPGQCPSSRQGVGTPASAGLVSLNTRPLKPSRSAAVSSAPRPGGSGVAGMAARMSAIARGRFRARQSCSMACRTRAASAAGPVSPARCACARWRAARASTQRASVRARRRAARASAKRASAPMPAAAPQPLIDYTLHTMN
jgi:hypothetical protein